MTMSPVHSAKPLLSASVLPPFLACRTLTTRGSAFAISAMMDGVRSVEQSSTTITSATSGKASTADRVVARVFSSLKAGTTTDTRGGNAHLINQDFLPAGNRATYGG